MKTVTFDETKWKLAPVEPTQEMIDAMPPVEEIGYWAMYSAALDAAPAAPPQPVTLTESERADMICAVAQICTGSSRRTLAALAIEWTERRFGIASKAQTTPQPAPAIAELPPYIYGREAGANEKVWTEQAVRAALRAKGQP